MSLTCSLCNTLEGNVHEWGCRMETCPFCKGFLAQCRCHIKRNRLVYEGEDYDVVWRDTCIKRGRVPYQCARLAFADKLKGEHGLFR